jgi:hypothetical protein
MKLFSTFWNRKRSQDRLREVEELVQKLQVDQKTVEAEWASMYDQFSRLLASLRQQGRRKAAQEGQEQPEPETPQQRILRLRGGRS